VVTCIGKNKTIAEEIIEGKDGVKFRKLNIESERGRFYLSKEKVDLNEIVQKHKHLSPQAKSDMKKILAELRKDLNYYANLNRR